MATNQATENEASIPEARLRNIPEKKEGYEYIVISVSYKQGLKFGLGIKNVIKNIYIFKVEDNSMVSGLFNVADRVLDVDGEIIIDNNQCRQLLVKGLKEKKMATVLVERGVTEDAKKMAMDEMNEEHNVSIIAPPDVRNILKRMEQKMTAKPAVPSSGLTQGNAAKDRKACIVEDGHKSVMIKMDGDAKKLKPMTTHIQHIFIINRAGSLIYHWEAKNEPIEVEKTYNYPIDVHLEEVDQKAVVVFGEKEGVKLRYYIKSVNNQPVSGIRFHVNEEQHNVLEYLENKENYPVTVKFAAPTVSTNEKIILSSTFHSLFAFAVQLSPCTKSSGVEILETTQFKLYCLQSRTGVKFVVITSSFSNIAADTLLSKMYELYADYALKNPFYSIDMPIRAQKFEEGLRLLLEKAEKSNGAITF